MGCRPVPREALQDCGRGQRPRWSPPGLERLPKVHGPARAPGEGQVKEALGLCLPTEVISPDQRLTQGPEHLGSSPDPLSEAAGKSLSLDGPPLKEGLA